jgi:hypothetical protein
MKKLSVIECKAHVAAWESSGLSKAAYCRRHDLPVKRFYSWCDLYSQRCLQDVVSDMDTSSDRLIETEALFAQLMARPSVVEDSAACTNPLTCELTLPSGVALKIHPLENLKSIADLVGYINEAH